MKIKELIKKLLGYKTEYTSSISNLNDCIPILSREIFDGDEEKLRYLEDIKKEYSEILFKKRSVLSMDLNTSNLYEQMNMYIEMLHDLLELEEVDKSFEKAFYYNAGTKKINIMIKMSKLKLYYYNIEQLAIEANVRRMALKEIFDEKLFLSSKKKNSIKEEMNHLAGSLIIYTNQIQAIKLQIDSYLVNYEILGKEEFVEEEIETELLNNKQEELEHMIKEFIPENREFINKSDNEFLNIALMEETLSKYIYEHKKEEVKKFREEISLLQAKMKVSITDNFTSQIDLLEMKLKALFLYGHNIVKNEDVDSLYELKFMDKTEYIMCENESFHLAEECNFIELECYGKIIMEKISSFLQDIPQIKKLVIGEDYAIIVEGVKKILKNKDNEFSFIDILNDRNKLGLLLAMEGEVFQNLEEYFYMFEVSKEKYSFVDFHEQILEFMPILSLSTIYDMIYYNGANNGDSLYQIYKIVKNKQMEGKKIIFPNGLTKIDKTNVSMYESFIEKIRHLSYCKDIEFPSSFSELNFPLFAHMIVRNIEFSNGITKICNSAFQGANINRITFPSSLVVIDDGVFDKASVVELCFENYRDSRLDDKSLCHLVKVFFMVEITDVSYNRVPNWIKEEQQLYEEGECSWYGNPNLLVHDKWNTEYELVPTFSTLILNQNSFLENDREEIRIEKEELKISYKKESRYKELNDFDYRIILDELKKLILSKMEKEKIKRFGSFSNSLNNKNRRDKNDD